MSRYGYKAGYKTTGNASGFINRRTGGYVSVARAHQHVGQNFGGYTKVKSAATGNYYMRKG